MECKEPVTLEELAESSVLPMLLSRFGLPDEPLEEVIICTSISGGAKYENNMPAEVALTRKNADGTEYQARYGQIPQTDPQVTPGKPL